MAARIERTGSAYDLAQPSSDEILIGLDRRTPMGELLRRYWHPVAVVDEVGELPLAVRVLGEDLVLFRTPGGKYGLVYPRCIHRGTTLIYGKVEDRGIRCCYHGWLFDCQGRCIERPCEPDPHRVPAHYIQPWYPVAEQYGLVFAYLGPLDAKPPLPKFDVLEELADDEHLVANGSSVGSGGPERMDCHWLQTHENVVDPYHVFILHATFSTAQFTELMAIPPDISWSSLATGMYAVQDRDLPDGRHLHRVVEMWGPTVRIVPDPTLNRFGAATNIAWTVPIDSTTTRIFTVFKMDKAVPVPRFGRAPMYNGKTWFELDDEGHQRYPGDYEAQVGQGPITLHSEEHLAHSDEGVRMFRKLLRDGVDDVAAGKDPFGIERDNDGWVKVSAGNFV